MDRRVERLGAERERDFLALMGRDEHEGAQCWCVRWWVPDWPAGTGPEALYVDHGFTATGAGAGPFAVYRKELT